MSHLQASGGSCPHDPIARTAAITLSLRARQEGPNSDAARFHDALQRLARFDPPMARLVEMLYLGGMTVDRAAQLLRMPEGQAVREWMLARAWMRAELSLPV
ncbi:MAG: hypothetical protein JNL98_23435 [Bryobacterales bacterium]|nr:hypothetical protein [Bryobacterales bacterium]